MTAEQDLCSQWRHVSLSGLFQCLRADIRRFLTKSPDIAIPDDTLHRISAMCTPQLLATLLYRVAHWLWVRRWRRTARWTARLNYYVHKVTLPPQTCIGPGLHLPHPAGVTFCGRAGEDLTLYSLAIACPAQPWADMDAASAPRLGDRVTLGAHAVVMGPVTIGADVRVAYSVRIVDDVHPGVMAVSSALRVRLTAAGQSREGCVS